MSQHIWTRCGGISNQRRLEETLWRTVEAQHYISTLKLVDSLEEQRTLENLLEEVKPPAPSGFRFAGGKLHFLLFTPFRYPPLPNGSRFGSRQERSLFYGALELETTLTEVAYYRLVFLNGSAMDDQPVQIDFSCFSVDVATDKGVDLRTGRFRKYRAQFTSKSDYAVTQALGHDMRDAGVEAFLFSSARAPAGTNAGLFEPVFKTKKPKQPMQTWSCFADKRRVEFRRMNTLENEARTFVREQFMEDGRLPQPAVT